MTPPPITDLIVSPLIIAIESSTNTVDYALVTAGFPLDDSSGLVQYSGCRRYLFVLRPVLKILGHSAHRILDEKIIKVKLGVNFLSFHL